MLKEESESRTLLERRKNIVANAVGTNDNITVGKAKGAILTDLDGNEFIDFSGGIGVVNSGHCPEPVVKAIQEQAEKFIHTSINVATYKPYIELLEKLAEIFPHGKHTKGMLVNSGAEAIENAIKIARQATGRSGVISFTGAFHGRTLMAMSLTSKIGYKLNCGPFAPEVYKLPFPNFYRYHENKSMDEFVDAELKRLHEYAKNVFNPKETAAVVIELVQGEGGFNPVPKKYLEGLRAFCDEHGIMLVIDEIQSGFCRTGHWAAWQHYGVQPDISTYAKSLGSGMPIAAVLGSAKIMDAAQPGTIGGTFIGNPLSCASALATLQIMKDKHLNKRGEEVGKIIEKRFKRIKKKCAKIGDERGLGAMRAIEFVKKSDPRQPDGDLCQKIKANCAKNGLIILTAGTYKNVIRMLCPLVITDDQLNKGLDILEEEIYKATKQ